MSDRKAKLMRGAVGRADLMLSRNYDAKFPDAHARRLMANEEVRHRMDRLPPRAPEKKGRLEEFVENTPFGRASAALRRGR